MGEERVAEDRDFTTGPRASPESHGHIPVMREQVVTLLTPAVADRDAVYLDATVGLGGHAEALLERHPRLRLIGLDRDPVALARAGARLGRFADRVELVHAIFSDLATVLDDLSVDRVDAVLFDLGVSSPQLDEVSRGFSYAQDAPLDMRMDQTAGGITAEEIVNSYPAEQLARILREYGEERYAGRIAAAIVAARRRQRLTSSAQLAQLVRDAIPAPARRHGGHPAKRTFQALRIEVNGELEALRTALPDALARLRVGGRLVALSYHSLEDRIVKQVLTSQARSSAPPDLPIEPENMAPTLRLLTRGAQQPDEVEVAINPRAASARLRAAEKIREGGGQ